MKYHENDDLCIESGEPFTVDVSAMTRKLVVDRRKVWKHRALLVWKNFGFIIEYPTKAIVFVTSASYYFTALAGLMVYVSTVAHNAASPRHEDDVFFLAFVGMALILFFIHMFFIAFRDTMIEALGIARRELARRFHVVCDDWNHVGVQERS